MCGSVFIHCVYTRFCVCLLFFIPGVFFLLLMKNRARECRHGLCLASHSRRNNSSLGGYCEPSFIDCPLCACSLKTQATAQDHVRAHGQSRNSWRRWRNAILAPLCRRFPRRLNRATRIRVRVCIAYHALVRCVSPRPDVRYGGSDLVPLVRDETNAIESWTHRLIVSVTVLLCTPSKEYTICAACTSRYHCPLIKRHIVSFDVTFDGTTSKRASSNIYIIDFTGYCRIW